MSLYPKRTAILVAGGPAPGINSVIGAAAIRAILSGGEVIGIKDGFKWIMQGEISRIKPLTIDSVSRIHFRGGSYIGIARDNPTKDPKHLENTVTSLLRLNVDQLITIGGDDTAFSAYRVEQVAKWACPGGACSENNRQRYRSTRSCEYLWFSNSPSHRC